MAAKNSPPDTSSASAVPIRRLQNRSDFLNARNGARSHERAFVLQLVKRDSQNVDGLRVGLTVTKKTGNAVVRNRIKRRLREAIKQAKFASQLSEFDMVLIARKAAMTEPFENLVNSLTSGSVKALSKASTNESRKLKADVANQTPAGQKPFGGKAP